MRPVVERGYSVGVGSTGAGGGAVAVAVADLEVRRMVVVGSQAPVRNDGHDGGVPAGAAGVAQPACPPRSADDRDREHRDPGDEQGAAGGDGAVVQVRFVDRADPVRPCRVGDHGDLVTGGVAAIRRLRDRSHPVFAGEHVLDLEYRQTPWCVADLEHGPGPVHAGAEQVVGGPVQSDVERDAAAEHRGGGDQRVRPAPAAGAQAPHSRRHGIGVRAPGTTWPAFGFGNRGLRSLGGCGQR